MFLSFGVKPLPLTFSPILTLAPGILHTYSTDKKTSRLMVKQFSTVRDTQRDSQSYKEKRRGKREIEVTRRRGGVKKGEKNLASNQFLMFSPLSETSREIHRVTRRREEGGRGDQEERRGDAKGERSI